MIDLGVWRQSTGIVVRLYGSERLLSLSEFNEFLSHCQAIRNGAIESVSEGYRALSEDSIEREKNRSVDLGRLLNLRKPINYGDMEGL